MPVKKEKAEISRPQPDSPMTSLPGIGPAKAAAYAKMGVKTLGDLIYHIPRAYENRGAVKLLSDSADDGRTAVILTVASVPVSARLRGRMTILKFKATDDSGVCEVTFFNQPYLKQTFVIDSVWRFFGTVEKKKGRNGIKYLMTSPAYERVGGDTILKDFVSVYPLSGTLTQKQVSSNVDEAVRLCGDAVPDLLPDEIRRQYGLCTLSYALKNIHCPEDYAALARAKKRLVFDELFLFSVLLAGKGKRCREAGAFPCTKQNITPMLKLLPYELTGAQKRAVREIAGDMRSEIPMSRIIIGDVGCGKTAVAAAAMYIAVLSGRQAVLMAPTEILARQHYEDLSVLFSKLGVRVELLVGAMKVSEKKRVYSSLADENPETRAQIAIGTHALITEGVVFSDLALAITDEQHRFGVAQRAALSDKAKYIHTLAMSATPIPRSLALVLYGDLDISKIDEMPAGRQKIDTYVADEGMRDRVIAFIRKTVDGGGQVYVVCPSIEESEAAQAYDSGEVDIGDIGEEGIRKRPPMKAVKVYAEQLREWLPDYTVALVHGKLKADEKEAIMTGFAAGDINILVSTTVIEVGVNVPNATLMIVENADRFGLSQLHQLRGRVGRGDRKSYCILMTEDPGKNARTRLETMEKTNNGFEIAEADLKTRGPGDFVPKADSDGIRQSGGLRFRFADLGDDASLLAEASEAARRLLEGDPSLGKWPELANKVAEYNNRTDNIS